MEELENMKMLVKQELETQLNSFEDLEIGSDEQKKAMDAFEKSVNSYKMIIDTQNNIERSKAELELQKAKAEREEAEAKSRKKIEWTKIALDIGKAILGFGTLFILGNMEAVDYSNGEIKSKPVADQLKSVKDTMKSWIK